MAVKITSGEWIGAAGQNRRQRDELRSAFFARAGIQPAPTLRDVHVPAMDRPKEIEKLLDAASGDRIGDAELVAITRRMWEALRAHGLNAVNDGAEHRSWGIIALSPEVLKAFFLADHDTILERSMMD